MMFMSTASLPIYASPLPNFQNTRWAFTITPSNNHGVTGLRAKNDASGTYACYNTGTVGTVTLDVLNAAGVSQCEKKGVLALDREGLIAQYVYENGFNSCKLEISANSYEYGGAEGEWSPDSIGSYPYLNL